MGLKTTYYLRTLAATQVEKSTVSTAEFGSTHTRETKMSVEAAAAAVNAIKENLKTEAPAPAPAPVAVASPMMKVPDTAADAGGAAPKRQYVLHRAPEVACESCQ
jgi:ribonucleoside-diphosphate reductase alpha chain